VGLYVLTIEINPSARTAKESLYVHMAGSDPNARIVEVLRSVFTTSGDLIVVLAEENLFAPTTETKQNAKIVEGDFFVSITASSESARNA
jgi:hypothetical protein